MGLSTHLLYAGFNFTDCSGSGTFEQEIMDYDGDLNKERIVGTIPSGIIGLKIDLFSDRDIDIRLYGENDDKIVRWPKGLLNTKTQITKSYKDVPITYSGFNGIAGAYGHEFITVNGTTPTEMTMKVFGYDSGLATVNYRWTDKVGCSVSANGMGTFTQDILKDESSLVGEIPANLQNVNINLSASEDIDIRLYGEDGTEVVVWPTGLLSSANKSSTDYKGMTIEWSGYNGTDGEKGDEYIKITGKTSQTLVMKVYGYEKGEAQVNYSWGMRAKCGNGTVEKGETCDDGNTLDGDECSAKCTIEAESKLKHLSNKVEPCSVRRKRPMLAKIKRDKIPDTKRK